MDKRVFITGAGGFVGAHLSRVLRGAGYGVFASQADIVTGEELKQEILDFKPEVLIHLAAISHPTACERNPALAKRVNVEGTARVLELAHQNAPLGRVIFASTAQVYAPQSEPDVVLSESSPLGPINLYASTKLEAEQMVRDFSGSTGVGAVVFRIFNHVHHSQPAQTFLSSLYQFMQNCPSGRGEIPVGNLDLYRDIGAIRDLLSAFVRAVDLDLGGHGGGAEVLNICNGRPRLLRNLARILADRFGGRFDFVVEASRLRPGEPVRLVGSHALASQKLGWQPRVSSDDELIDGFLGEVSDGSS